MLTQTTILVIIIVFSHSTLHMNKILSKVVIIIVFSNSNLHMNKILSKNCNLIILIHPNFSINPLLSIYLIILANLSIIIKNKKGVKGFFILIP